MTIHSDWGRILHDECPEAFHKGKTVPRVKGQHQVGIIDGHLASAAVNCKAVGPLKRNADVRVDG